MRGEVKCQPGAVIGRVIMSSWEDKVVIITGGAAGIGRATAMLLADVGARVLVTGRRSEPLKRVTENRDNMDFILADATQPEDAYRTIAKRQHHKKLGVVPGGGVEPPRYQVPADFESAASASSAIPALRGSA